MTMVPDRVDDHDRIGCGFEKPLERHRARKTQGGPVRRIFTHSVPYKRVDRRLPVSVSP